ncbi:hypothetical protein LJR231_001770 [Phyllobacterium sp. LjRoot231]|uniref:hypothetical protein n=1 Tax=Phyllobacterium sp. LjRoot231 TaxID=3342289 RepID=UPI003ECF8E9A
MCADRCEKNKTGATESLEAARRRGKSAVADILSGDDMLTAEEFSKIIGAARATVNNKRQRHQILGLDGPVRGYKYPRWQLDANGKPFPEIPDLFDRLGGDAWEVYRFLMQRHAELDGLSGKDALHKGQGVKVIDAAESVARAFS